MPRGSLATSGSSPPLPPVQAMSPAARPGSPPLQVMPLQGWHLPLLVDPQFVPLQPLLQRCLLEAVPQRLLQWLRLPALPPPQVLVAASQAGGSPQGLLLSRCLNRRGSCWSVQHLRLATGAPARSTAMALLKAQISRITDASSWIVSVSSLDQERLGLLRELGFQPLRSERLWRWDQVPLGHSPLQPTVSSLRASAVATSELQLRPLQRRSAPLHWHLEQAACPPQFRQLLDRRVDDLLDDSRAGWMLVDPGRRQAVAGIRLLVHSRDGGQEAAFSVHPLWLSCLGPLVQTLLELAREKAGAAITLSVDCQDTTLNQWLEAAGAEALGERVLMVRSVWRRQIRHPVTTAGLRLGAVLEQWQPRRPIPTPALPQRPAALAPSR